MVTCTHREHRWEKPPLVALLPVSPLWGRVLPATLSIKLPHPQNDLLTFPFLLNLKIPTLYLWFQIHLMILVELLSPICGRSTWNYNLFLLSLLRWVSPPEGSCFAKLSRTPREMRAYHQQVVWEQRIEKGKEGKGGREIYRCYGSNNLEKEKILEDL